MTSYNCIAAPAPLGEPHASNTHGPSNWGLAPASPGRTCTFVLLTVSVAMAALAEVGAYAFPAPTALAVQDRSEPAKSSKKGKKHSAELRWQASASEGVVGYYVYRAVGSSDAKFERITPRPVKETRYKDTHVKPGKTYFYAVTAVQKTGSGMVESERTPLVKASIPYP